MLLIERLVGAGRGDAPHLLENIRQYHHKSQCRSAEAAHDEGFQTQYSNTHTLMTKCFQQEAIHTERKQSPKEQ